MELYLSEKKTDKEIKLGEYFTFNDIINEDCDLYNKDTGDLVFSFKKKVIPKELYDIDPKIVKHSKDGSVNRGNAAGSATTSGLLKGKENWSAKPKYLCDKDGNKIQDGEAGHTAFFRYEDGRISKRARSNTVSSQSIGGFNRNAALPCRLTYFTKNNLEEYKSIFPLTTYISDLYFSYVPDKWLNQFSKYENSPKEYVIPDSNFSTLTINQDFRTASHKDSGDCKTGLTCFTVKNCGSWSGGELCFPNYELGLNIEEGDLLLFNPHVIHSNNSLKGSGRMSFVLYLRDKMDRCYEGKHALPKPK